MYRDNTLIPSEAVRLLALGILAGGAKRYAALAEEVRHFSGRIVGPSLDLVGTPLELLKVEGLIEPEEAAEAGEDPGQETLRITPAGGEELRRLLSSNVRAAVSDLNKLIIALKVRFLHHLPPAEQAMQLELLIEMSEREIARLIDLRAHHDDEKALLASWLDQEVTQAKERLAWYRDVLATLHG